MMACIPVYIRVFVHPGIFFPYRNSASPVLDLMQKYQPVSLRYLPHTVHANVPSRQKFDICNSGWDL